MRRSIEKSVFFVALSAALLWPLDAAAQLTAASFSPPTWYGAGANSTYSVAVGDLNGDGFPDLVTSSQRLIQGTDHHTGVFVFINNGNGTFQSPAGYPTDGYAANPWESVAIADVDGDGKPDLVVLNSALICCTPVGFPSVSMLRGNGDGTFQTAVSYPLSIYPDTQVLPTKLTVADVNGDGKADVLVSNSINHTNLFGINQFRGGVSVLVNNGDGTFASAVLYDSGGYHNAAAVIAADVNGDGFIDILATNTCSTAAVNPGNGSACFDVNLGHFVPGAIGVLLGNGNGTFQTAVTYASGGITPGSLAAVDLNRDGSPDLLVTNAACFSCGGTSTAVLIANGNGSFQTPVIYSNGAFALGPVWVAAGDVDGDGLDDVAVLSGCGAGGNCAGALSLLLGNGDGTLEPATVYLWESAALGISPNTLVLADLNKDAKPDVVVATWNSVGFMLNQTPRSATITTLLSEPNPSGEGLAMTLTATVSSAAPGVPTGTVTFREGATILGNAPLVNAEATLSFSGLSLGSHDLVASYSSDSAFRASESAPLAQVVVEALRSLTVSPASVIGGVKPKGTVTLNGRAPLGGVVVTLSSADPAATVPASVKIAAGASSASFTITTTPVSTTAGPFDISASYRGVTRSAPLTVRAATTSKLTVTPASVVGGASAQGTVTLTGRAPAGGASVALASANPSATVAGSVIVPPGSTSATFTVATILVATTQGPFNISATYNGVTRSDTLIVKAPAVLSVLLNPTTVAGGSPSTGTVTLTGPAPSGGMTVTLNSSKIGVATVPLSLTVPATSTSATFDISTLPVAASSTVTISATAGGTTKKATLTVTP